VHIKQLGANFGHIGTVRSAVDARRVQGLEVQRGKICAEHGKARVQIEVEPLSFDDVGDYCGHLAKQASAGREGLRQALYELIEVRSSLLFPARGQSGPTAPARSPGGSVGTCSPCSRLSAHSSTRSLSCWSGSAGSSRCN
jgi:hypothetical protein